MPKTSTANKRSVMLSIRLSIGLSVTRRGFSSSSILLKKSNASRKGNKDTSNSAASTTDVEESVDPKEFLKKANTLFSETVELHDKKLSELKQGKANPKIFDELKLLDGKRFTDVASTSVKGKNALIVTVYDPKDTKNIISTIMGAGLNLNPEKDVNNDQMLKVLLPPPTTESRLNLCKELKQVFEHYKNSTMKQSLGYIRGDIIKQLKQFDKRNDSVRKVSQDLEKIHKDYTTKLQEQLKQAEKSIMN